MSIVAKAGDSKFEKFPLPEEGTVQAVCAGVWDLGMQRTNYNGVDKLQHKVVIAWELNQLIDSPESEYHQMPYMLSKTYTLSLYENANLRHDLESWRGKPFDEKTVKDDGFDVEKLYGINCLVGVAHVTKNDRTFANITSILPLMKGTEAMKPVREKNAEPPNWVKEKQAMAVVEEADVPKAIDEHFDYQNDQF